MVPRGFLVLFLALLSIGVVILFRLLVVRRLGSRAVVLLLSILVSGYEFYGDAIYRSDTVGVCRDPDIVYRV